MDQFFLITALLGFALLLAATVATDLISRTIPNRIPLGLLALTPLLALGFPGYDIAAGLMTGAAVFAFGLVVFHFGWLGGGDVKLVTAIGVWAGPTYVVPFLAEMAVAGGLVTLGLMAQRAVRPAGDDGAAIPPISVPYGVAIAVAGSGFIARLARDGGLLAV